MKRILAAFIIMLGFATVIPGCGSGTGLPGEYVSPTPDDSSSDSSSDSGSSGSDGTSAASQRI